MVLTPVRTTIPLSRDRQSPADALADCGSQVFTAVQPYRFWPAAASVLKKEIPGRAKVPAEPFRFSPAG